MNNNKLELIELLVQSGNEIPPPIQIDGEYVYMIELATINEQGREIIRNYNYE